MQPRYRMDASPSDKVGHLVLSCVILAIAIIHCIFAARCHIKLFPVLLLLGCVFLSFSIALVIHGILVFKLPRREKSLQIYLHVVLVLVPRSLVTYESAMLWFISPENKRRGLRLGVLWVYIIILIILLPILIACGIDYVALALVSLISSSAEYAYLGVEFFVTYLTIHKMEKVGSVSHNTNSRKRSRYLLYSSSILCSLVTVSGGVAAVLVGYTNFDRTLSQCILITITSLVVLRFLLFRILRETGPLVDQEILEVFSSRPPTDSQLELILQPSIEEEPASVHPVRSGDHS